MMTPPWHPHRDIASDRRELAKLGITHILNCAQSKWRSGAEYYAGMNIAYQGIEAHDSPSFDMSVNFYPSAEFIHKALCSGGEWNELHFSREGVNPTCRRTVACMSGVLCAVGRTYCILTYLHWCFYKYICQKSETTIYPWRYSRIWIVEKHSHDVCIYCIYCVYIYIYCTSSEREDVIKCWEHYNNWFICSYGSCNYVNTACSRSYLRVNLLCTRFVPG